MDFTDYQTLAVIDNEISDLPEPNTRLNLNRFFTRKSDDSSIEPLKIPTGPKNAPKDIYLRLKQFTTDSMERTAETPSANQALTDAHAVTDELLSKRLSVLLNDNSSYHTNTLSLRHNLSELESSIDLQHFTQLSSADYVGVLQRKSLKSHLENKLLTKNVKSLQEFGPVVSRIKKISQHIDSIKEIRQSWSQNGMDIPSTMINEMDSLNHELKRLKLKKQILNSIKLNFSINQVEDDIIKNGDIDESFFQVIEKLMDLKAKATYLLALDNNTSGQVLINKTNATLEFINKKLYHSLMDFLYQQEYSNKDTDISAMSSQSDNEAITRFQKSLIFLSNDLDYFDKLIKNVSKIRSKSILDEFLRQFDMKSNKGTKPITLSAYDPIRYIGDILAAVHALIANESDFINSLFRFKDNTSYQATRMVSILIANGEYLNGLDQTLLNQIAQALTNSCRIRIHQVIRFAEQPTTNLQIVELLRLYKMMFTKKSIQPENSLLIEMQKLETISMNKLLEIYDSYLSQNVIMENVQPSADLLAPDWVMEYMKKLTELFDYYQKHMPYDSYSPDESNEELLNLEVLKKLVQEPLVKRLDTQLNGMFSANVRKSEKARSSFLTIKINSYDLINSRLQPYRASIFRLDNQSSSILDTIESKLLDLVNAMKSLQVKLAFEKTGLANYYNLMNMIFPIESVQEDLDLDMYLSLSDNSLMSLSQISKTVHDPLNEYLPQLLTDLQCNLLFNLASPSIVDGIREECFGKLSQFYAIFIKVLMHLYPDNLEEIREILNFSPLEFDTVLGIVK